MLGPVLMYKKDRHGHTSTRGDRKEELNDGPEIPDKSIASEETGRRNQMTALRFQTGA